MRYLLLAAILAVSFGNAGTVSAQELIGVSGFTATNGELSGSGTLGGVDGTIASTVTAGDGDCANSCSGTFTMTVGGATFASGTFSCDSGTCLYLGKVNTPDATGFAISTIASNIGTNIAAAIYKHSMWVNDVSAWANANPTIIAGMNMSIGDFVSHATSDSGLSE